MTSAAAPANGRHRWLMAKATRARDWLLDLVFPPNCGHCDRVDFRFCDDCLRELERVPVALSSLTGDSLDGICATGGHCGVLQNALQSFKYESVTELSAPLAARLAQALHTLEWRLDIMTPVPLFADREAERGYNQAALLSGHVAAETGALIRADVLKRIRSTSQQALLSEQERQDNVRDAFEASGEVQGLSVLLIDDVATTGSTLRECANALKAKGAGQVYGIAVSHSLSGQWVRQEASNEY